ncbi:TetR/AcrR family transcriptional regulator [Bacillus sp. FJAT-49732]|uniref:TetR/AcrR family transcriptional regulator n=1 Tax=Lederbergia citrisecunda TaxID=2833583 RepID=A0A942YMP2_9BACI|nr:TetR/AcrR family transcriptional regulator [Lederbergia citrisecunda]MBS4201694.1 TetR/AcrR family transcriptional regulator [Lederbergia citrisecunda]
MPLDKQTKSTRTYQMKARAHAAEMTGERILDAAVEIFYERPIETIPLDEVASRAGVTVQTVIRRFGGKEGLFIAAVEREAKRITSQRDQAGEGNVEEALRILIDHYEEVGDGILRMLAEEDRIPALREIIKGGRIYHYQWCERVFAPALTGMDERERKRRHSQLIALTDIYVWKLLRRDRGLSRNETELALNELLQPLIGGM